jgi:uncharacterized protein with NAD-binding domain and iron-sulfur cluster
MPNAPTEKIAILGGGISALTAAYFLTDPSLAGRFQVTVYSMGWRLGGKGASGRNLNKQTRIEEHGLHIWFGCYPNAIAMMTRCYAELGRGPNAPLPNFQSAFKGQDRLVLMEEVGGEWRSWPINFPRRPDDGDTPTVLELLRRLLDWLRPLLAGLDELKGQRLDACVTGASPDERSALSAMVGNLDDLEQFHVVHLFDWLKSTLHSLDERELRREQSGWLSGALRIVARLLWSALKDDLPDDDTKRRLWISIYLGITFARGILDDQLFLQGFKAIDGEELRGWLCRHSSFLPDEDSKPDQVAFFSSSLQSFYDASFSYDGGDPAQPNISAAVGLRCILAMFFGYHGPIIYEMQAGMGDAVFAPLYLVLKKRGVQFSFFNRVTSLRLDSNETAIDRIELSRQVILKKEPYHPLICVKNLLCWPSTPLYDQIVEGNELAASCANLEHWNTTWTDTGGQIILKREKRDFDQVILAISYRCLPFVTEDLSKASSRWSQMLAGLSGSRTQAFQLWFGRSRDDLGMTGPAEIFGGYVEPWSSLADFSHLLAREGWPSDQSPKYLCYSCGTLSDSDAPDNCSVYARLLEFVQNNGGRLWPGAYNGGGFDWTALYAPPNVEGPQRLKQQYWRANVDPTENYVIAKAGTATSRLSAGQSGFNNLVIAGEWTETGINISSIESTVISGMRASRAISGVPARIVGEN